MIVTLTIDTSVGQRRFGVLKEAWDSQSSAILREFDRYKRQDIDRLFATGGDGKWPEPSDRSQQRNWKTAIERAHAAPMRLRKKLIREFVRAKKRLTRAEAGTSATDLGQAHRLTGKRNAVARRYLVLKEFERQMGGGTVDETVLKGADRRLLKSVRGLQDRFARQSSKVRGPALGKLPQTIRSSIRNGTLTIDSAWDSPAVAALNDGATVNRGAEIQPYKFFEWTDRDIDVFAILLREAGVIAWGQ